MKKLIHKYSKTLYDLQNCQNANKSKNPSKTGNYPLLHICCNWYVLTLKFEVEMIQSFPWSNDQEGHHLS